MVIRTYVVKGGTPPNGKGVGASIKCIASLLIDTQMDTGIMHIPIFLRYIPKWYNNLYEFPKSKFLLGYPA